MSAPQLIFIQQGQCMKNRYTQRDTQIMSTLLAISVIIIMAISACATLPFQSSEAALRARIDQLMTAKAQNDWAMVYSCMEPAYQKQMSKDKFLRIPRGMAYENYSIQDITVAPSGKEATATVLYDVNVLDLEFKDNVQEQKWIKDGFSWYLKVEGPVTPMP